MKVCFLARPSFDRFSVAIFHNLKEKYDPNIDASFITSNSKETRFIQNSVENAEIYETSAFLRKHWAEFTYERLVEFEKKYDCAPIWKYIYTDRFLVNRNYDYVVHVAVGLFSFFEEIFKDGKTDFYYSETIATLQCYVAYIVGKKYGVQYIAQMCSRGSMDSMYHYFVADEYQHNANFDNGYKNVVYTKEEWEFAEKYLSEFETKDSPPPAMQLVKSKPRINSRFVIGPIQRIVKRFDKLLSDPCSYMYFESYKSYTDPIKYYFNYQKAKKYYQEADYEKKYVYYPLHYQPEASTCVCAQKYENQMFFIDSWAKSLPADTVLYVKEHYALLGNRDPHFYVDLKKYPNVFLINPLENSRKLIENATAVTTLTGTAGFEALLLRKPVFLGGSIVFDNAPGVIKIDDIYQNYLNNMQNWKHPQREEVIQYLCACFRSYGKGNAYAQNFYHLINENIDDLCNTLYLQMVRLSQ